MDLPTRAEIETLGKHRGWPSVTIVLRTTPLTQAAQADRIALRNLLDTALAEVEALEAGPRLARAIRQPVEALIEDDAFWAEQANSLVLCLTPEGMRSFRLPNRLANQVEVSDRFHLKPLLRAIAFPHHAWVLAIGMGATRLVEVSAELQAQEVRVPDLPRDAGDATGRGSHITRKGDMASGLATSEHALMSRYARSVDRALRPVLAGREVPLILAAAEPMASLFRSICTYPHLAAEGIAGSPDHMPNHALAEAAGRVLDGLHAAELQRLGDLFARHGSQGRATTDIAQAARAATRGAVDTLLVDLDAQLPGTVGDEDGAIDLAAQANGRNYSITDEIARRTLNTGGRVLACRRADIPGGGELAAILRYPV
ncbi:baeRF11 domain-containing protein [Roseicella aquatilis]|uniref:Chemotaxis protein n=1 Tax=Roseicella aquatilis TaxID=2527868 RepID=A0A4R4DWV5_9PROT|nr:hypothetical protein [Roseicella aquatilis]TCZ66878.1 hypothetical protein EXY23_01870 [Roseicella aquatilis]